MSYHSQHMKHMIDGVRGNVEVLDYKDAFKGVTWDNLKEYYVSKQEYGNTKFSDVVIFCYFVKNHFSIRPTSNEIGYSNSCTNALRRRLDKVNTKSIIELTRALMINKLIEKDHVTNILNVPFDRELRIKLDIGKGAPWKGKYCRLYCRKIIWSAIRKWGNNHKIAAKKLGISMKVMRYWKKI